MSMKNIKVGQTVRVIGDSFSADPHGVPVGTMVVVEKVVPEIPFGEHPPFIQLILAMAGKEGVTFPERLHVKTLANGQGHANIPLYDVEVVGDVLNRGQVVRMLEDDYLDGFSTGDEFELVDIDGELGFYDHDGDARSIEIFEHEII